MIRVLHISGCGDAGGISSVILNYYQFIDRSQVHFDLALTVPTAGQNAKALENLGSRIFFLPLKSQDPRGFREQLQKLLREGKYDALHVHESETCFVALKIAKELGIPCRIAHAHTASPYEGISSVFRRWAGCLLNYHYASHVIGCGQLAGDRVFGWWNMKRSRALVLPNAVDTERFAFNPTVRQQLRSEWGMEENLILGMVARLSEMKNVPYAVKLMEDLKQQLPEARLVIGGNGEDEEKIKALIHSLSLEDRVLLLGRRSDPERLYQAFDLMLMPSFSEGFPVAAVEAMSAGLPVLISDRVTKELSFGSAVTYLPLKDRAGWIKAVTKWREDPHRADRQKEARDRGLDIRSCAGKLQEIYHLDTGK